MKAILVGGGKKPSQKLLNECMKESEILICADGGGDCLYEYSILPDYLVGDFDSISKEAMEYFRKKLENIDTYPSEKNSTDSEICVEKALSLGVDEIIMLGFTGSRLDHVLGNLGLLQKCMLLGIKGAIADDNNYINISNKSLAIKRRGMKYLSLQAYSDVVDDLTITGAKYPLDKYTLLRGDPRTISNEFINDEVCINFSSGTLLIIQSMD